MKLGILNSNTVIAVDDGDKDVDFPPEGLVIFGYLDSEGKPFVTWGALEEVSENASVDPDLTTIESYEFGAIPDGQGGWVEYVDPELIKLPIIPVLISYNDSDIDVDEVVDINVKFLVPGQPVDQMIILTRYPNGSPVTQPFTTPFSSNGQSAFNQKFIINEGEANFKMKFPEPKNYFIEETEINSILEENNYPFRIELYNDTPNSGIQKGDVKFVVYQQPIE